MPNIDYDPQNPADIFDRPIKVGDVVAWGTVFGRSPALCIARIEDIVFTRKERYENVKCERHEADRYTLRLRPIQSTGDVTWLKEDGSMWSQYREPDYPKDKLTSKAKTVQVVKNVCLLELPAGLEA